ncbi:MAG: DUF58 domain-containing protein [Methylococcaceae bacterium]|nr:DUF58 domain-containing protein [Methylococcaceae bacterium]
MNSTNSAPARGKFDAAEKIGGSIGVRGIEAVEVGLADLIGLNRWTEQLSLKNLKIRSMVGGNYISRVKGRGMEFDEVRLYAPGDDIRCLDWRVTARTGKVHTKLYREERERPIFVATDYRSTMFFATRGVFKSVLAAKLAALLAWIGNHHADRVGGQIFTERTILEFKPRRGNSGILLFLKHLADLSSKLREGPGLDALAVGGDQGLPRAEESLGSAFERLNRHARPGNLIFLLSDFRGLNPNTESLLLRLTRHCEVVPILIYDPLECRLPEHGSYRIANGGKRITLELSDIHYQEEYREKFRYRQDRLQRLAVKQRLRFLECCTVDKPLDILARLFAVKLA